jgi:hypothetical protein
LEAVLDAVFEASATFVSLNAVPLPSTHPVTLMVSVPDIGRDADEGAG